MKKLIMMAWVMSSLLLASGCDNSSIDESPILSVNDAGDTSVNIPNLETTLESISLGELNPAEIEGLLFMREEEKLAHDVYTVLYDQWSQKIFNNISNSEQTHTEAMLQLLNRYGLDDPAEGNGIGVFTNTVLQDLNNTLVASGSASLIDALMVGAAIEEIDMIDIKKYIDQVVNNDDIVLVYESLLKGSRNHLRAFVSNLEKQGVIYIPQYMDSTEYENIINAPIENG